jgi:adenylate cyclase
MSGATTHQHAAQPPHLDLATSPVASVSPEAVRTQLARILASDTFVRSKGLCRFLKFAVEQKLRNQSVRLKEYLIGVTVFNRGEAFNPSADPIVRVQARRLRSKLNLYYETEGCADQVQIDLPCGGYVPVFQARTSTMPAPLKPGHAKRPAAGTAARPSVVVLPFVNIGPHENERFSDGLTEELTHVLSQTPGMRVVARTSAFQFKGTTPDIRAIGQQLGVNAVVEGSVRSDGDSLRVSAGLIDVADGGLLWSGVYQQNSAEMFAVQRDLSERIARKIEAHLLTAIKPPRSARSNA